MGDRLVMARDCMFVKQGSGFAFNFFDAIGSS